MFSALLSRVSMSKLALDRPATALPDRHGLAIAVILRNEARHIGEWAAFHAASGVRHIYAYDDGSCDATVAILRRVLAERVTVLPWAQRLSDARLGRELHNQVLAYAHAVSNFGGGYRWMACIDADEFLVPTQATDFETALAGLTAQRNISLPWHMFGTGGHQTPPDGGVVRNFLQRAADPMSDAPGVRAFKCLVDPCHVTAMRVHSVETDGQRGTSNDAGQPVALDRRDRPEFYSRAAIQLNHYYTRSVAELEDKIGRGPNLSSKHARYRRKVLRTVASIEAAQVEDVLARDHFQRVVMPWMAARGLHDLLMPEARA